MLCIILYSRTINSIIQAECNIFLPRAGPYFRKSQKTIIARFAIFAVETALCRKLNRVPPLRRVFDFLTLVNLMNQFRRMVDQPHGRFTRHTGAAQAVDIGNAPAVKTKVRFSILMKNCCHRRDGWNGNSTVNFRLVLRRRSNSGRSADGIGTENARSSPSLGAGKVILSSLKSMQFIGSRVSRNRQPVCREISNAVCIHSGELSGLKMTDWTMPFVRLE